MVEIAVDIAVEVMEEEVEVVVVVVAASRVTPVCAMMCWSSPEKKAFPQIEKIIIRDKILDTILRSYDHECRKRKELAHHENQILFRQVAGAVEGYAFIELKNSNAVPVAKTIEMCGYV